MALDKQGGDRVPVVAVQQALHGDEITPLPAIFDLSDLQFCHEMSRATGSRAADIYFFPDWYRLTLATSSVTPIRLGRRLGSGHTRSAGR